jgi:hypothetical protein
MANTLPYELFLSSVLTAGGTGTMSYQVPPGQKLIIDEFVFISTGAFNVVGMRNGGGQQFTNATPSNGIPSTMLANGLNQFNVIKDFKPNLEIQGGDTFYIDIIDTSAAPNTVRFLGNGSKDQQ